MKKNALTSENALFVMVFIIVAYFTLVFVVAYMEVALDLNIIWWLPLVAFFALILYPIYCWICARYVPGSTPLLHCALPYAGFGGFSTLLIGDVMFWAFSHITVEPWQSIMKMDHSKRTALIFLLGFLYHYLVARLVFHFTKKHGPAE